MTVKTIRPLSELEAYITPLISQEKIHERCVELGEKITREYEGRDLVVIGVLKGVFPFFADLVRQLRLTCSCDFLGLSSYGSRTQSSGVVRMTSDLSLPVNGRDVLIVEDIVDTGLTMSYLLKNMQMRMPATVQICTLLHKPARTRVPVHLDHVGFTVEDQFVVGYGLDYEDRFRNLPYIGHFAGEVPSYRYDPPMPV